MGVSYTQIPRVCLDPIKCHLRAWNRLRGMNGVNSCPSPPDPRPSRGHRTPEPGSPAPPPPPRHAGAGGNSGRVRRPGVSPGAVLAGAPLSVSMVSVPLNNSSARYRSGAELQGSSPLFFLFSAVSRPPVWHTCPVQQHLLKKKKKNRFMFLKLHLFYSP